MNVEAAVREVKIIAAVMCVFLLVVATVAGVAALTAQDAAHAAAGAAAVSTENRQRTDTAKADALQADQRANMALSASQQAATSAAVLAAVQASRLAECEQTNARHDATVRALNTIYTRAMRRTGIRQRGQLRASHQATLLIVDALAPRRNCAAAVGPTS